MNISYDSSSMVLDGACTHASWSTFEPQFFKQCAFVGGFASVYPDTMRMESDLFVVSWEKNEIYHLKSSCIVSNSTKFK